MPELKLQQSRLDGRYDIIECLGRGSYAEIYVARDNAASADAPDTVVIKALNMFLQDTPDADLERTLVENFQNEAVALDRVRHPNIISRLGHGTAIDLGQTTFHYLVLEYLSGGDMAALSRHSALPIEKALFYLEQVCSGLAHAHECGVIHRDIKPQNLLLTADRQILKIADFGVARLEAHDGAITRVGTNIYSAPEHNPLVQTGQLDTGALALNREHLTPAADIYSLAKTTYTLLAGESPRRFAQHPIREMPTAISEHYWSAAVLRVLEKATQTRPENRYQTVQEFWDELSEASLPPTKPLQGVAIKSAMGRPDDESHHRPGANESEVRRRPSFDLAIEPEKVPQAAPEPRFTPVEAPPEITAYSEGSPARGQAYAPRTTRVEPERRPKIVVPVSEVSKQSKQELASRVPVIERIAAIPQQVREGKPQAHPRAPVGPRRARPFVVAAALILGFTGMLLATHKYATSRWNPFAGISRMGDVFVIGREGVTTTDVNLRSDASTANPPVGVAENGSRIKILAANDNWYEIQVLEHGRPKTSPFTADRGWINKKFVKFD